MWYKVQAHGQAGGGLHDVGQSQKGKQGAVVWYGCRVCCGRGAGATVMCSEVCNGDAGEAGEAGEESEDE